MGLLDDVVHEIFKGYSYNDWQRLQKIGSLVPIFGTFKAGAELLEGREFFTGEDLSTVDQVFNGVDAVSALMGLAQIRHVVNNRVFQREYINALFNLGEAKRVEHRLNLIAQGANKLPVESRMTVLRSQLNAVTAVKLAEANLTNLIRSHPGTAQAVLAIIAFTGKVGSKTATYKDVLELYQFLMSGIDAKTILGVAVELDAAYEGKTHNEDIDDVTDASAEPSSPSTQERTFDADGDGAADGDAPVHGHGAADGSAPVHRSDSAYGPISAEPGATFDADGDGSADGSAPADGDGREYGPTPVELGATFDTDGDGSADGSAQAHVDPAGHVHGGGYGAGYGPTPLEPGATLDADGHMPAQDSAPADGDGVCYGPTPVEPVATLEAGGDGAVAGDGDADGSAQAGGDGGLGAFKAGG